MGPGGWVFKISKSRNARLKHECLSQNDIMIVRACGITYTSVCICNMQNQLKNINISQANDLFTPKPAKLDKHIHIYNMYTRIYTWMCIYIHIYVFIEFGRLGCKQVIFLGDVYVL